MKCLKKPVSLLLVLVFLLGLLPGTALAVSSTTVYFDATGGTVDPASKETTDSTYGTLPTPTRYGYVFAGWYDAEKDGNQVSSSTEVPTEEFVTLYAYWTPVQCTVSFDTAGGTVATSSVPATYGSVYSILPVPVREGYSFAGWYTAAGGNVQVTEGALCQWPFDHTLYARWVENADEKGRVSELTYRFDNSAQGFGYDQDYTIPLERYQAVFGATPLAHTLYTMQGSWSGNCFGMSTTSGLVFQHSNGITPSDFNPRAARLSDLGLTDKDSGLDMTVQEFVETMQISQLSGKFNDARVHYMNNLDGICQAVEQFAGSGNFAPVILIYGQDRSGGPGGHAVVGYKLVEKSATESWLMIYDCNYPGNEQRHITLTKDIDGAYTGWEYELVGLTASSGQELPPLVWGSGQPNSSITCVTYADYNRVWSERGTAENSLYSEEDVAMMWINTYNAEIRDEHNEVIAVVRNGWLSTNRPDKIQQIITVGMTLAGATAEAGASQMQQDTYLTLPVGFYTITNTDSAARNLAVEIFTATADTIDAAASIDEIYDYDFIDATSTGGRISLYLQTEPENRAAYVAAYGAGAEYSFYIVTPWDFGRAQMITGLNGICAGQKAALARVAGQTFFSEINEDQEASTQPDIDTYRVVMDSISGFEDWPLETLRPLEEFLRLLPPGTIADYSFPSHPFEDMPLNTPLLNWAYQIGIASGTGDGKFSPTRICTHAEAITFLWRIVGCPQAKGTVEITGVQAGDYFYPAVQWAVNEGFIDRGSFQPGAPFTIPHWYDLCWRIIGRPEPSTIYTLPGVPSDSPYIKAISWYLELFKTFGLDVSSDIAAVPMTRLDYLEGCFGVYRGLRYNDLDAGDNKGYNFLDLFWQTFS